MEEIYVRLLGEGTDVYRPVKAIKIKAAVFKIEPHPHVNFDDEEWEFPPGATVLVEDAEIDGRRRPLAVNSLD